MRLGVGTRGERRGGLEHPPTAAAAAGKRGERQEEDVRPEPTPAFCSLPAAWLFHSRTRPATDTGDQDGQLEGSRSEHSIGADTWSRPEGPGRGPLTAAPTTRQVGLGRAAGGQEPEGPGLGNAASAIWPPRSAVLPAGGPQARILLTPLLRFGLSN